MSFCSRKDVTAKPKVSVVEANAMTTANNDTHFELTARAALPAADLPLLAGLQFLAAAGLLDGLVGHRLGDGCRCGAHQASFRIWITLNTMIGMTNKKMTMAIAAPRPGCWVTNERL